MFLFEHEEWALWRILIACADDFEYQYTLDDGAKRFVNRADNNIVAYIWSDGMASVHFGTEKVLCGRFQSRPIHGRFKQMGPTMARDRKS